MAQKRFAVGVARGWQRQLWRRLRDSIGSDSPAEWLLPACEGLRHERDVVDLPERLSLFGPTRLSTDQLAVLLTGGSPGDASVAATSVR